MTPTERARRSDVLYDDDGMTRRTLCDRVAALESLCGDLADVIACGAEPGDWSRLRSELRLLRIGGTRWT